MKTAKLLLVLIALIIAIIAGVFTIQGKPVDFFEVGVAFCGLLFVAWFPNE